MTTLRSFTRRAERQGARVQTHPRRTTAAKPAPPALGYAHTALRPRVAALSSPNLSDRAAGMATGGGNPESEALGKSPGSPKLGVATEMGAAISAREGRRDASTATCDDHEVFHKRYIHVSDTAVGS